MTEHKSPSRADIEAQIVARAWADPDFAARLRRDPKSAITEFVAEAEGGFALPDDVEVTVVEETPNRLYLVLPQPPRGDEGELSDEALASVSGGFCYCSRVCR
jgi:hypothetical protein